MTFALQFRGSGLFRRRAELGWLDLAGRAQSLGWDGQQPVAFYDSDGALLGGFVPR